MQRLFCLCLTSGLLLAGDGNGIRPRGNPTDYPVHQTAGGITLAGAVIPPDVCRKIFSIDLDKAGYVVVEIAIYPEDNRSIDLASNDFMLRLGSESDATRAVSSLPYSSKRKTRHRLRLQFLLPWRRGLPLVTKMAAIR
jgi:hypothetical protein